MNIDVNYSMHNDSFGKDPDTYSKTLHEYHYHLWNKKLPNGDMFHLTTYSNYP